MTQRAWQNDMEMMKGTFEFDWTNNQDLQIEMGEALPYWLQEAKERGEREQRHKEPRPLDEWHEDFGDVLWWTFPIEEPPYCGSPLDLDWPDYHTHWTPILIPDTPAPKEGIHETEI